MKFSVAPESNRTGVSVLLCAACTYARRLMAFQLDMYTFSNVFLNHAVCTSRASASSFWEMGPLVSSLCSLMESSVSLSRVSGVLSDRSNVTALVGCNDSFVIDSFKSISDSVLLSSDPSKLHKVLLFVELLLVVESGVVLGFRSFSKCFMQKRIGCSPPHSLHRSGGPI